MKFFKIFIFICNYFFINNPILYSNIQVSLQPLYIIVSSLAEGISIVDKPLIGATQGHHGVQLSHKQVNNLINSELFIWIGEKLEGDFPQITCLNKKGINFQLENSVTITNWKQSYNYNNDFHIWMNPDLVVNISREIAAKLLDLYPNKENKINLNLDNFLKEYNQFSLKWRKTLVNCKIKEYMVSHNAISHIANFMGLQNQLETYYLKTNNHSVKNLNNLNELLGSYEKNKIILFNIDGNEISTIEKIFKGNNINTVRLDVMGAAWDSEKVDGAIKDGKVPYFLWLNDLCNSISENILILD